MSFNGRDEAAAFKARLETLANGRVYEGVADSKVIPADPLSECLPHIIVTFSKPVPKGGKGRAIAVSEAGQPHIFLGTATAVASDETTARRLSEDIDDLLTGWAPNPPNSTGLKGRIGASFTTGNFNLRPSRWHRPNHYECFINQVTAPDPT